MQYALFSIKWFVVRRLRKVNVGWNYDRTPHESVQAAPLLTPVVRVGPSELTLGPTAAFAAQLRLGAYSYRWHLVGSSEPAGEIGQDVILIALLVPPETCSRQNMTNRPTNKIHLVQKASAFVGALFNYGPYVAFH
jgi:hypothetical protein